MVVKWFVQHVHPSSGPIRLSLRLSDVVNDMLIFAVLAHSIPVLAHNPVWNSTSSRVHATTHDKDKLRAPCNFFLTPSCSETLKCPILRDRLDCLVRSFVPEGHA